MANYIPVEVSDKMDLKCAMETGSVVIVITDKEFFSAMDGEIAKDKAGKKTNRVGKKVLGAGVGLGALIYIPLGFFTGGLGCIPLAVTGAGALGSIIGGSMTKFKEYAVIMDYAEKRVIMLKKKGKQTFNEKKDTIEGIDLKDVLQRNSH